MQITLSLVGQVFWQQSDRQIKACRCTQDKTKDHLRIKECLGKCTAQ